MGGAVWTTFYPFQWDLNWTNPEVFLAMLDVMLQLANHGVEAFRLDSTAFLWTQAGFLHQLHYSDTVYALRRIGAAATSTIRSWLAALSAFELPMIGPLSR